ncbi:uncharacterized protein LOC133195743 [Saccostrea echinata]|uniref:uncharacterized protein LOC133195743 n=1 Tax=Saccostrea echinata TaxID=191078 RepID=UPI002A80B813|nr:uncharacterized protein LOC133195743 [Saccostrea echinata]
MRTGSILIVFVIIVATIAQETKIVPKGCRELFDLSFVIDGSDSISAENFEKLRVSVARMVDSFHIGSGQTRMGIVVYSKDVALSVPLSDDPVYLRKEALGMPHPREGTNTHLGIEAMVKEFRTRGRPGVPKAGVVVTDGISKDEAATQQWAKTARDEGINMFSVGIGRYTEPKELEGIASAPNQAINVDSFDELLAILQKLVQLVCPNKCMMPGVKSYPHDISKNCRIYWKCEGEESKLTCCPKGYAYSALTQSCVQDPKCVDPCGNEGPVCKKRPAIYQPNMYEELIEGYGWVQRSCPFGRLYNQATCGCTIKQPPRRVCKVLVHIPFDYDCIDVSGNNIRVKNHGVKFTRTGLALFENKAKLVIPNIQRKLNSNFVIKMRYKEFPSFETQGLLSNGDCYTPNTMMVFKNSIRHTYKVYNPYGQLTSFSIPTNLQPWNEVTFSHDGNVLGGSVNGVQYRKNTNGPLQRTPYGISIGFVDGYRNFQGYMDYVTIYKCTNINMYTKY